MDIAQLLFGQIVAAGVEIVGLSIGASDDKATWTVQPTSLQSAAQPTIDAFDISTEETAWQWAAVRAERDSLLYGTDWTQSADSPLDVAEVADWATYRQALRDIPAQQADPYNIAWPSPLFPQPTVVINPLPV
jgi:hypothetical protein